MWKYPSYIFGVIFLAIVWQPGYGQTDETAAAIEELSSQFDGWKRTTGTTLQRLNAENKLLKERMNELSNQINAENKLLKERTNKLSNQINDINREQEKSFERLRIAIQSAEHRLADVGMRLMSLSRRTQ